MKTIDDFKAFFEGDLAPQLKEIEADRLVVAARAKKHSLVSFLLFGAFIAISFALALLHPALPIAGVILSILFLIFFWAFGYFKITKSYSSDFKNKVIENIIQFIDPNLTYAPTEKIGYDEYQASKIFRTEVDRYEGEDLIYGKIGETELRFSELHAQYKRESKDNEGRKKTDWYTIFKGIFFIADFNKSFRKETYVLPDLAEAAFGGFVGNMFQSWNKTRGELIKMEDPEFEKHFVVYGSDQIESRYILSTSLMRRINDYKKRTDKEIYLSFIANKVYVAITYHKNLFEPKLFKTVLDFEMIKEYYEDVMLAISIVDDLKLNRQIWERKN